MCRIVFLLLQHLLLLLLLTRLLLLLHPRVHFRSGLSRPTATANPFCFLHRESSPSPSNSHINMFFPVVCPIGCRHIAHRFDQKNTSRHMDGHVDWSYTCVCMQWLIFTMIFKFTSARLVVTFSMLMAINWGLCSIPGKNPSIDCIGKVLTKKYFRVCQIRLLNQIQTDLIHNWQRENMIYHQQKLTSAGRHSTQDQI